MNWSVLRKVQLVVVGLLLAGGALASEPDGLYTPWLDQTVAGDVVYFAMVHPPRVDRFNMVQQAWLEPIPTISPAQAIAADGQFIVTVEGNQVRRYPLNNESSVLLAEFEPPREVLLRDGVVIVHHGDWYSRALTSINLYTGMSIDSLVMGLSTPQGIAMPRDLRRLYGLTAGSFPGRLVRIEFAADGQFGSAQLSGSNLVSPRSDMHYAFHDGSTILTSGGQVFDGEALEPRGGSGGIVGQAVIGEDVVVILRDQTLTRLDSNFRELGMIRLPPHYEGLAMHDQTVFLFRDNWPSEPQVSSLALNAIVSEAPPAAPDTRAEPWLADEIEMDDQGIIHLHERERSVVHRFSLAEWDFIGSLALSDEALHLAVVPETGDVLLANAGGRLGRVPAGSAHTDFVVYAPWEVEHIAAASHWLYAAISSSGTWIDHRLYSAQGQELAVLTTQRRASAMRWCSQTRRLYYVPAFSSPNRIHWTALSESGQPTANGSLAHNLGNSMVGPIRPSSDGTRLVAGSGQVFDTDKGSELVNLGGPYVDMAWIGNEIYTIRDADGQSLIERWSVDFDLVQSGILFGQAQRLMVDQDRLVFVASRQGGTWIQQISPDLTVSNVSAWLDVEQPFYVPGGELAARAFFRHEGAGEAVEAEIRLAVAPDVLLPGASWLCETEEGPFSCGQPDGLSESVSLDPGDWVRVSLSGSIANDQRGPITLTAEILPEQPDFESTDNVAEQVLMLNPTVFRDRFEQ